MCRRWPQRGRTAAARGARAGRPACGRGGGAAGAVPLPSRSRNSGAGGLSRPRRRNTLWLSRLVSAYPARPSQRLLTSRFLKSAAGKRLPRRELSLSSAGSAARGRDPGPQGSAPVDSRDTASAAFDAARPAGDAAGRNSLRAPAGAEPPRRRPSRRQAGATRPARSSPRQRQPASSRGHRQPRPAATAPPVARGQRSGWRTAAAARSPRRPSTTWPAPPGCPSPRSPGCSTAAATPWPRPGNASWPPSPSWASSRTGRPARSAPRLKEIIGVVIRRPPPTEPRR